MPKPPTTKGPAELFTGDVHFDVIARGEAPSRLRVNLVRFAPGARTAWHRHSLGQTLHVTDGIGLVQARGGEVRMMRPGDTVYTPPGRMALARGIRRLVHVPPRHVGGRRRRRGATTSPTRSTAPTAGRPCATDCAFSSAQSALNDWTRARRAAIAPAASMSSRIRRTSVSGLPTGSSSSQSR